MQINIFGEELPTSEIPRMNCTNDENCKAEADEHAPDCPVEVRLKDELGF